MENWSKQGQFTGVLVVEWRTGETKDEIDEKVISRVK